jgi:hypothetical protein
MQLMDFNKSVKAFLKKVNDWMNTKPTSLAKSDLA